MAVTKTRYGRYIHLAGTAGEVLQALSDEKVQLHQIAKISDDLTDAVFVRGNA